MVPHLFVDISSHGFGHLAQTAPVLNALRTQLPDLRLTIRCGLSKPQLKRHLVGRFSHIPHASDFGLIMHSALDVDVTATLARYRAFHSTLSKRIAEDAVQLAQRKPSLILANISYLTLAAAAQAKIPAWGMGSLNWAEIFYPYSGGSHGADAIRDQMLEGYRSAEQFLRITPGMAMPSLKVRPVGPIARSGKDKRHLLKPALGLAADTRLVLIAMGGLALNLPDYTLPSLPRVRWIAPSATGLHGPDVITLERFTMDFKDVVASCDALFTKSGYGSFVEASVCGTRVFYVERPDWAEEPALTEWLQQNNVAQGISRTEFDDAEFGERLTHMLDIPPAPPVLPTGIDEAANLLAQRLLQAS